MKVNVIKRLIDCDADPEMPNEFISEGCIIAEHIRGGQFEWDASKVWTYLSPEQQDGKCPVGHEVHKQLKRNLKTFLFLVLNACVLDYLLANPHLIPDEWKNKLVFFWGTTYRHPNGDLYVRFLQWGGISWFWGCRSLGRYWDKDCHAVLASD